MSDRRRGTWLGKDRALSSHHSHQLLLSSVPVIRTFMRFLAVSVQEDYTDVQDFRFPESLAMSVIS